MKDPCNEFMLLLAGAVLVCFLILYFAERWMHREHRKEMEQLRRHVIENYREDDDERFRG